MACRQQRNIGESDMCWHPDNSLRDVMRELLQVRNTQWKGVAWTEVLIDGEK
jgi:hypothetical protein